MINYFGVLGIIVIMKSCIIVGNFFKLIIYFYVVFGCLYFLNLYLIMYVMIWFNVMKMMFMVINFFLCFVGVSLVMYSGMMKFVVFIVILMIFFLIIII